MSLIPFTLLTFSYYFRAHVLEVEIREDQDCAYWVFLVNLFLLLLLHLLCICGTRKCVTTHYCNFSYYGFLSY